MATFKASGETVIPRAAKDGTNGVGISSADVVFTVAEASAAPTAKSSWVSEFTSLTLAEGKYVWCATKTVYTNGTTAYTGIYQLGKCEDFAGVTEQYALSDSPTTAPTSGWAVKYTPTQGKYLWTRTQYTYRAGSTSSYSTPTCVGYFATNGTSFTPKGTAAAHYANYAAIGSITSQGVYILVDDASGFPSSKCSPGSIITAAPSVAQYVNAPDYTWDVWPAESGDAYRVGTNLWVNNGTAWVDFGDIQGPEGDPGEDAVNVLLSCSTLTFEWINGEYDHVGNVAVQLSKGGTIVPTTDYTVKVSESTSYNSNRVSIRYDEATYSLLIPPDGISTTEYTEQDLDDTTKSYTVTYPVSTAAIVLAITDNTTGTTVYETLTVNVNFTRLYGSVAFNDKSLRSTYSKVTSLDGEIERCNSQIEQTATSISTNVSSLKSNAHTNLFGFCKDITFEGGGTMLPYIQAYGVYYTGSTHYRIRNLGFNGTGGDFVVRCRVYSSAAVTIGFEVCDVTSNEGSVTVSANTWTTVVRTFSGVTSYVESSGYNGFFDAEASNSGAQITIADLSIERGTVAPGVRTVCKEDAAAFGKGYRIQEWNSGASATTDTVNGESTTVYYGAVPSSGYADFLYKNGNNSAGDSKVYTLSFWAKAEVSGMKISSYLYGNGNCPSGGQEYTEALTGGGSQSVRNAADGYTETALTTTWKKYYVHWKTVNGEAFNVIPFRADSANNASYAGQKIYVANVVFEEGYVCEENAASAYSYSKIEQTANSISLKVKTAEDAANTAQSTANAISQGLKDTGIDIESKKVTVTADNFQVQNNSGETTMTVDKDGNLCTSGNASFKGTVYANGGSFKGTVYADGGSFKNMSAENITGKNFTLESGKIACFDFTSSYIGVASSSSDANTMHLGKDVLIFNGKETGHQTVIGPGSGSYTPILERLTDTRNEVLLNKVGLAINIGGHITGKEGKIYYNYGGLDAIQIGGGCISGFKLRTTYMTSNGTIDKLANVVWIDASNTTVYLPDLGQEAKYDGHVIMIRSKDATATVKASGSNGIYYNNSDYSDTLPGDAIYASPCTLVFFAQVSYNDGQYKGLWVMI